MYTSLSIPCSSLIFIDPRHPATPPKKNGAKMEAWRAPGAVQTDLYIEAVFGTILNAIGGPLPPPWDLEIHEIQVKIWIRNRTPFGHGF